MDRRLTLVDCKQKRCYARGLRPCEHMSRDAMSQVPGILLPPKREITLGRRGEHIGIIGQRHTRTLQRNEGIPVLLQFKLNAAKVVGGEGVLRHELQGRF